MDEEKIAEIIRTELDCLLADYIGDAELVQEEGNPADCLLAQSRIYALDWLREMWSGKGAEEERMIHIARSILRLR